MKRKLHNLFLANAKLLWVLCFSLGLLACNRLSAQARFSATAPKSVPVNQNFQLNLTVENANGSNPRLPATNDFQVVGGPNTSTSVSISNGSMSQSVTYSYILHPKQEGTFKLGKASITVDGVTMQSNDLTIEVTKPQAQQPQAQQNPFDPFANDPFFGGGQQQNNQPQMSQADLQKQLKDDVFLRLVLSKSSVYKGEMITATYKLYFRQNLNGYQLDKSPAFDGFMSQEVDLDPKRRPGIENLNGKQYNTIELLKYNLYPQRTGNLQVASPEVNTVAQVAVRSRSNGFFDAFFNAGREQQVPLTLKSQTLTVSVKDLPEAGKPANFSGAVGKFNFETSLSSKDGKTDDPITYTIKISGTGNFKVIDAPGLTLPPAFEVYDPKVKDNINNSAGGMSGSKQYDYLIIPRQPGDYKIDSKSFSYFDPNAGKYFTVTSPEYALKITGAPSKNANAGLSINKQDVSILGQDIRYIKTNTPQFKTQGNSFFGSAGFTTMYATPFLLFIGLIVLKRRNETLAADVVGSKRRKALKLAKKRLSIAEKHCAQNDRKNFYDEVSRAIWGYLGNKLNIDMAELSKDNVEEKLLAKGVKAETITKLKDLINTCEMALYTPSGEHSELRNNYQNALNLIADLEDEIK